MRHFLIPDSYAISPEFVEQVRDMIAKRCSAVPVRVYRLRDAEEQLAEAARAAIVEAYQEAFPHKEFRVKPGWPRASAVILDDEAIITPWFGDDDAGYEIERIRIIVLRAKPDVGERIRAILTRPSKIKLAPMPTAKQKEKGHGDTLRGQSPNHVPKVPAGQPVATQPKSRFGQRKP